MPLLIERRPSRNRIAIALTPVMMLGAVLFSSVGGGQHRELTSGAMGAAGGAIVGAIAGAPLVGALAGVAGGVALAKLISPQTSMGDLPCLIGCEPIDAIKPPAP